VLFRSQQPAPPASPAWVSKTVDSDAGAKSLWIHFSVIPAKAGIQ